jgi:hypothetical protein
MRTASSSGRGRLGVLGLKRVQRESGERRYYDGDIWSGGKSQFSEIVCFILLKILQ